MNSLLPTIVSSFRLGLRQLIRHKVRSFLTLLGILIGVGAVMTIVSLGEGLKMMFTETISSQASADMIYVMPDVPIDMGGNMRQPERPFKNRDMDMISESEFVSEVMAGHILNGAMVKHGWRSMRTMVQMVPPEYLPLDGYVVERGRAYNKAEQRARANVCIVGSEISEEIYEEGEEILNSYVTINGIRFKVIGILEARSAMQGGGQANTVICIPLETGQERLLGNDDIYWMAVKLRDSNDLVLAKEDLASRLRVSRRIRHGKDDDFELSTPDDWAGFVNGFLNMLIGIFGVIAVIALVVGGIGVMNIMLVSVKERTREIGLRKALGATAGVITWQFLIESVTMSVVGGILGIAAGYGLATLVTMMLEVSFGSGWTPSIPFGWLVTVIITSVGIGLVFGVYPAFRAGKLDPIDALRYE